MKNNVNVQKAFTLVELIVVITILAILWTIAFLSMQSYSADARNSKRTSHVNAISNSVNIWITQWASIISYVTNSGSALSNIKIAWTWAEVWVDYNAWPVKYESLNMKQQDFVDPSSNTPYVLWVTTKIGWKYEVATINEVWTTKTAFINWNYVPRANTLINTSTWIANTWSWYKTMVLPSDKINSFFLWDTILAGTSTWKVTIVSKDLSNITFDGNNADADTIQLAEPEDAGLINGVTTTGTPVTNGWTNLPY